MTDWLSSFEGRSITRRDALKHLAAAGLATAAGACGGTDESGTITLRWWSTQGAPAQRAAYRAQIDLFEAAHPGVKVVFEEIGRAHV